MKIVGIDSAVKGLAIVSLPNEHLWIPQAKTYNDTLLKFFNECATIQCDEVFIEEVVYVRNYKSTLLLAGVYAVVKLAFLLRNIPVNSVNNMTWKAKVVGTGKANKAQIKEFVMKSDLFALPDSVSYDIADAACIALYGERLKKIAD